MSAAILAILFWPLLLFHRQAPTPKCPPLWNEVVPVYTKDQREISAHAGKNGNVLRMIYEVKGTDENIDIRGEMKHPGDRVELSEEDAAELVASGVLEATADQGADTGAAGVGDDSQGGTGDAGDAGAKGGDTSTEGAE